MDKKTEIIVCLGSSCFSRGNKQLVKIVDNFLKEHSLISSVKFHGAHCMGSCENGPLLKMDGEIFTNINEQNIIEILTSKLLNQ